jgi:KaiC/GvpD/RAD55 family RecA-like ATPase
VLQRLTTDIPGLDQVLAGGLVRGDAYLVIGAASPTTWPEPEALRSS